MANACGLRKLLRPRHRWVELACVYFLQLAPVAAVLQNPTFLPANGSTDVPLRSFSALLTFQETVQFGTGDIIIRIGSQKVASYNCQRYPMYLDHSVLLPFNEELESLSTHVFQIPQNCFLNPARQPLAADLYGYQFTTIQKGTDFNTNDVVSPTGFPLVSPAKESWVLPTQNFYFYFNEAVQQGDSSMVILRLGGGPDGSTTSVFDDSPIVTFTPVAGEVIVTPKMGLETGARYEISFGNGAFRDLAGNYVKGADQSLPYSPYQVKVSTVIASTPDQEADALVPSSNLVFRFNDPVMQGTSGEVLVCQGQDSSSSCLRPATVPLSRMLFLGNTVIMNPAADLQPGQYNVSIPDTVISYFDRAPVGVISFSVGDSSIHPASHVPRLIAVRADCNGDGSLAKGGVSDECDIDEDGAPDFREISDTLDEDKPMRVGARFKLYFDERIMISAGRVAYLYSTDGISTTQETVTPSIGAAAEDSVLELRPNLQSGKLYTLSLGSGVVSDTSPAANAYAGTSIYFYTPMRAPTVQPRSGEKDVPRTTAIEFTFTGIPQIGRPPLVSEDDLTVVVKDTDRDSIRYIALTDSNQVKFQDNILLVLPMPPLLPGTNYTISLPKQSIRYMMSSFSLSFSTIAEDVRTPRIVIHYPSSTTLISDLEATAPWFLFSEGVSATAGMHIVIKEDGVLKYEIEADDSICGSGGTVEFLCSAGRAEEEADSVSSWKTSWRPLSICLGSCRCNLHSRV
jgi:hypothetical protein